MTSEQFSRFLGQVSDVLWTPNSATHSEREKMVEELRFQAAQFKKYETLPRELNATVARFLRYSFEDVDYNYDDLTDQEQRLTTPKEFKQLVAWTKSQL